MIHKITVENFYSIAEAQTIDFSVAHNVPDLPCFVAPLVKNNERLPVVVGFFGANASGKTNVLRALLAILITPFLGFGNSNHDKLMEYFQPYRQKSWMDKPTKITIELDGHLKDKDNPMRFRYELAIAHREETFGEKVIAYEALYYAPKGKFRCLFKRDFQDFYFGADLGIHANDPRRETIRPDVSVISALAQLNHQLCLNFRVCLRVQFNFLGFQDLSLPPKDQIAQHYVNNPSCLERINRELRRLDIGLESMTLKSSNHGPIISSKHLGLDRPIFFFEESKGTQSFIKSFSLIDAALQSGSIVIIDEIDTDFHPVLLPEILRWFTDPKRNPQGAQLFFTAHNPVLLDTLEKEQIFFTEKLSGQPSVVYGAKEIQGLRREPSLMKKYLAGELGAIPRIG